MRIEIDSINSFYQVGSRDYQEDARYPDFDSCTPENTVPFFVVCDGVGGNEKGEVASATVCEAFGEALKNWPWLQDRPFTDNDFNTVLELAYNALDRASNPENHGMATTLTFLALHSGGCYVGHIGDSRIYQVRPDEGVIFRTEDHSLVNALLRSGNITPEEAINHPKSNVITRCMSAKDGTRERDNATVANLTDVQPGDYFLLCTDGVVHCISDGSLCDLLSQECSDEDKINQLALICEQSSDNNTAILVHIGAIRDKEKTPCPICHEERDSTTTCQLRHTTEGSHDIRPNQKQSFFKKIFKNIFN